jgi:hypothetical protein
MSKHSVCSIVYGGIWEGQELSVWEDMKTIFGLKKEQIKEL